MDSIAMDIASACPSAFSGAGGGLFLSAVSTLIAAHCSIIDDKWPLDNKKQVIERAEAGGSYDYIVIGAGTAGSLIASKLSNAYPSKEILLVEAGDNPGLESEVPAFLFYNQNTLNDWNYKTEPDGRSCLGFVNNSCVWSKGKVMGGSSSINAMIYIRGHPEDYKMWGNGWDYNTLIPLFEKQERELNISRFVEEIGNEWYEILDQAWKELQLETRKYRDYEAIIGTKIATLLTRDGKRKNTAKEYLQRARTNLHIMKKALVEEIIIDSDSKRATGLRLRHSNGTHVNVLSNDEIILSAGSIGTPHLLMLSGIGLKHHLLENDIPCHLNLAVGQNLQDHLIFPIFLKTNIEIKALPDTIQLYLLQYMLSRTGPFSTIGITDHMGFINTRNNSNQPDIQFHHMFYPKNDKASLMSYLKGVGYKDYIISNTAQLNDQYNLLGIYPTLLHPKSKGEILLNGKDPNMKPKIKSNYLDHQEDIETMMNAIKFVRKLEKTEIFISLGIEMVDINVHNCSEYIYDSGPYWKCYMNNMATTIFHPAGTAKMGNDDSSVVDHNLLVRGIENLRIADASVMPTMPSANIMASTLVIAQKAVDIMTQNQIPKSEL